MATAGETDARVALSLDALRLPWPRGSGRRLLLATASVAAACATAFGLGPQSYGFALRAALAAALAALLLFWSYWISHAERRRVDATFRTLIENVPETIGVHSQGKLVYLNPALMRLFGYSKLDEVVGKPALDSVHPDDRQGVIARLHQMAATGEATPLREVRFLCKDGRTVAMETASVPLLFDGKPSFLVVGRDLTERKQAQAHLMAADRLASIGTVAAGVAHEINNPLAYVITNLEFLEEELLSIEAAPGAITAAQVREALEAAREAREGAQRVRLIVRDLKLFSRAPAPERAVADVESVLDSSINMAGGEIKQRARLVRSYSKVPFVKADAARLGQVFINLFVNAAHAIPEGGAEGHSITASTSVDAAGRVRVQITDTGSGIPVELRERIFEPFFTTKPAGVGTGLGLFVCQGIVSALGGELSVESEVGKGTTFTVTLPVACEAKAALAG